MEPKLDGWRVTVLVDDRVVVRTRRGHAITDTVPGIDALAQGGHRFLLDGELVAGAGRASDFYALLPRVAGTARRRPTPFRSFWAFDLLWLDGELLIDRPYSERREALEALDLAGPCPVLPRFPGTDANDLLAACVDHDVIVLERLASRYYPGERSRLWRARSSLRRWAARARPADILVRGSGPFAISANARSLDRSCGAQPSCYLAAAP